MSWFYERFELTSEKNGLIRCRRLFGRWKVTVDGYDQTSRYIHDMWQGALLRLPQNVRVKSILLLGFGAGGSLPLFHRLFPGCQVTILEWDSVMIEIARRMNNQVTRSDRLVIGDARETVKTLFGQFDLIVFDLYCGKRPAPFLLETDFQAQLQHLLSPEGFLLVNVFQEQRALSHLSSVFEQCRTWRFRYNHLGMFRLMCDFVPHRASPAFLVRDTQGGKRSFVDQPGSYGSRWKSLGFSFEGHTGNIEPVIQPGSSRLVIWQTLTALKKPDGWWRSLVQMNPRCTGYARAGSVEDYWKTWTPHAQRHRRRWLKDDRFQVEEIGLAEFAAAYRKEKKLGWLTEWFITLVKDKIRYHGSLLRIFGAREKKSGEILAGLAVLDIPEQHSSVHIIAFVHPRAMMTSVSVGLIDQWFQHALKRDIYYLDFDIFWAPGDPRSWKGFSRFKSQFGTRFIYYPNPFLKLAKRTGFS